MNGILLAPFTTSTVPWRRTGHIRCVFAGSGPRPRGGWRLGRSLARRRAGARNVNGHDRRTPVITRISAPSVGVPMAAAGMRAAVEAASPATTSAPRATNSSIAPFPGSAGKCTLTPVLAAASGSSLRRLVSQRRLPRAAFPAGWCRGRRPHRPRGVQRATGQRPMRRRAAPAAGALAPVPVCARILGPAFPA